jgi:hypothetical protein
MLGRKSYTREEIDHSQAALGQQLAAYRELVKAVNAATTDKKVDAAFDAFDRRFFNNMTLALDRYFVHRLRVSAGKDGNALNEVEMICDALLHNKGVLRGNSVIKFVPDQSVLKLDIGDTINLTEHDFERLSDAFFAELERKFL